MSNPRVRLGDAGERYAERRVTELGWRIISRKWRGASGEIDLVADQGDLIVFIEVKTRRGETHGRAEESVSQSKCARLIQLGLEFLDQFPEYEERFWRVDLIAITIDGSGRIARYTHIEDVCLDE